MATVTFKKKTPRGQQHRKRARVDDKSGSSSESEDEVVRKQVKTARQGIDHTEAKPLSVKDTAKSVLLYNADRSKTNRNVNDATREAADIDGHIEASTLEREALASVNAHEDPAAAGSNKRTGPVKAPANIRAISVIDYQPDVCKDYRQTGFCGFGDTCKFLHDRGEFKQGWQLDREWEDAGKTKGKKSTTRDALDSGDLSEIPFKCTICKGDYRNPIITKCGHYFCEACAIQRYKKTASCAQCGNGTGGLFSGAKKLKELLQSRQTTT